MRLRKKNQQNGFFVVLVCSRSSIISGGSVASVGGSFGVADFERFGGVASRSMVGGIGIPS